MILDVHTQRQAALLVIKVKAFRTMRFKVRTLDGHQARTLFNEFDVELQGGYNEIYVRMPISPKLTKLVIYNQRVGDKPAYEEHSFTLLGLVISPLTRDIKPSEFGNAYLREAIEFVENFAYECESKKAGNIYRSADRHYAIEFLNELIDDKSGKPVATPARVNKSNGIIQVNKGKFDSFPVPMRAAILVHEISHYYLNKQIDNEVEADLNAVLILSGIGFDAEEIVQSFEKIFAGSPSELNQTRLATLRQFANDLKHKQIAA